MIEISDQDLDQCDEHFIRIKNIYSKMKSEYMIDVYNFADSDDPRTESYLTIFKAFM